MGLEIVGLVFSSALIACFGRGPVRLTAAVPPLLGVIVGVNSAAMVPMMSMLLAAAGVIAAVGLLGPWPGEEIGRVLTVAPEAPQVAAAPRLVRESDALRLLLTDLAAAHVPGVAHGLLTVDRSGLTWCGGVGLELADLGGVLPPRDHPDIVAAIRLKAPLAGARLGSRGSSMLVPLARQGEVVALWWWRADDVRLLPDLALAAALAEEVACQLAGGESTTGVADEDLQLQQAGDEERRRLTQTLQALVAPVSVADLSGRIQMINPTMQRMLDRLDVVVPRTMVDLRQLVRVAARTASGLIPRLDIEVIRAAEDGRPIGFAAWLSEEPAETRAVIPPAVQVFEGGLPGGVSNRPPELIAGYTPRRTRRSGTGAPIPVASR